MKITIQRSVLLERLVQVTKAVPSKPVIPVLDGVLITSNSVLAMAAGDGKNQISTQLDDYTEHEAGAALIPARKLLEVVKRLPEKSIEITADNVKAMIKCGSKKVELPTLTAEDYPRLEIKYDTQINVDGATFSKLMGVAYARSTNEQSPILMGINLILYEGEITAVATDRHRLAKQILKVEANNSGQYTADPSLLHELVKTKPNEVNFIFSDSAAVIASGDYTYTIALLDGQFPDTSRIIPTEFETTAIINRDELLQTVELAEKVNDDRTKVLRMDVLADCLKLSVSNEGAKMEEQLEAQVTGEQLTISANAKYLAEMLKSIATDKVEFCFNGTMKPVIIKPVGDDSALHVVLPYRSTR